MEGTEGISGIDDLSRDQILDNSEDELLGSRLKDYIEAKHRRRSCWAKCIICFCPCCRRCCLNESKLEENVRNVLQSSEVQRVVETTYDEMAGAYRGLRRESRTSAVDVESGYIRNLYRPDSMFMKHRNLEDLRRKSAASKSLPQPMTSINESNKKAEKMKKMKKKQADELAEINDMMMAHVTRSPFHYDTKASPDARMSVFWGDTATPDFASKVLFELVAVDTITQGKRQSMVYHATPTLNMPRTTTPRRTSVAYKDPRTKRLSVSYSLQGIGSNKLEPRDPKLKDFLKDILKTSEKAKKELEKNSSHTNAYIKKLETHFSEDSAYLTSRKTTERWMVLFYTTSNATDNYTDFRCTLVRYLLQLHRIAYEERDVALKKFAYMEELQKRMGNAQVTIPLVFAHGVSIGGCRVIYGLHQQKKMKQIFQPFIMPGDIYDEWIQTRQIRKPPLALNEPLSNYPVLNAVAQGQKQQIPKKAVPSVELGKRVIVKARRKWQEKCRQSYTEYDLRCYVLLRATVRFSFRRLNALYSSAIVRPPPQRSFMQRLSISIRK